MISPIIDCRTIEADLAEITEAIRTEIAITRVSDTQGDGDVTNGLRAMPYWELRRDTAVVDLSPYYELGSFIPPVVAVYMGMAGVFIIATLVELSPGGDAATYELEIHND